MPATKPPYPAEFWAEAVRLVRESGKKLQQIAADLGVSEASLRKWVRQPEIDAARGEVGGGRRRHGGAASPAGARRDPPL